MKFTNSLKLHQNGTLIKKIGTKQWEVCNSFIWYLDYNKKDYYIDVEKGFETDFGSLPKFLQNIFNPTKYVSYILHDKLYKNPRIWKKNSEHISESKVLTRKQCDLVLLEGLTVEGASRIERFCIYIGVRCFGFLFFNKNFE